MLKFVKLVLISLLIGSSLADEISDRVFRKISIQEGTACYRLLNGTNQFGCHATAENENGVLVRIESDEELNGIQKCFRDVYEGYQKGFWIMIPTKMLKRNVIKILKESNCISGLVLYDGEKMRIDDETGESHDSECPNEAGNFYSSKSKSEYCERKINEKGAVLGEGLRNIDWKFQMVYIKNETELKVMKKCYELFNQQTSEKKVLSYPFCGMSFKLSNVAAGSSDLCYRRGLESSKLFQMNIDSALPMPQCSPLIGHNIFAWPVPLNNTMDLKNEPKYMIISAKMDSFGLIPEVSAGEISVLTSLIATIGAAKSIGKHLEMWTKASKQSNKYLMFAIFNGEAFDYIGSSAAVQKMRNDEFPLPILNLTQLRSIKLNQIDYLMEVQQIGVAKSKQMFAHIDEKRYLKNRAEIDKILSEIEAKLHRRGFELKKLIKESQIPPSSWHSFAKFDEQVQAIVLASFGEKYDYRRFNSMLDTNRWAEIEKKKVLEEIVVVAESILVAAEQYVKMPSEFRENVIKIDRELIETLLDCLVTSSGWFECDFIQKLNGGRYEKNVDSYPMTEKSTYVSVATNNPFRHVIHWLFIFAFGSDRETINVKNKMSCQYLSEHQAIYSYDWQPNPYTGNFSCLRSSIQYIQAQSPAFEIDGYSLSENRTFSTWTESIYTIDSVRLFLIEDDRFDLILFFISIFVAILSFFAVGRCTESTFIIDEGDQLAESGEPL